MNLLKPNYWVSLISALLIACSSWLVSVYFSPLQQVENWLLDLRVALLAPAKADSGNIVIVGITEDTLATLTYRQPVDRGLLADVLERVDRAGALVIGLDVLLDQATEPEKDQRLKTVLRELDTPVFAAYATVQDKLSAAQVDYLNEFVPVGKRALVNLRRDSIDGVVRSVLAEDTSGVPGLANALANSSRSIEVLSLRLDQNGSLAAFPVYPAHLVADLPDEWFAGKQVLIGASLPMQDRYPTSFQALHGLADGVRPGVEIHAHAMTNLQQQSDYRRLGAASHLLTMFVLALLAVLVGKSELHWSLKTLSILFVLCLFYFAGFALMQYLKWVPLSITPLFCTLLAVSLGVAMASRQHRTQKRFIRRAMSYYVAPEIVSDLQKHPEKLCLGGQRRELSMIFTDISGFTSLSERVEPSLLLNMLNLYLHGMSEIIAKHHGIVDKYIGDAVVGLFNAPLDVPNHAQHALRCAAELDAFALHFKQAAIAQGVLWGDTRIGLHTGEVIVGNMGGEKRFDYTAVGDAMNVAARLEGLNKYLPTRVCVSESTILKLGEVDPATLGICKVVDVVLKGKTNPVAVYTTIPCEHPGTAKALLDYAQGMQSMQAGETGLALQRFECLQTEQTELARLVLFQRSRLANGLANQALVLEEK